MKFTSKRFYYILLTVVVAVVLFYAGTLVLFSIVSPRYSAEREFFTLVPPNMDSTKVVYDALSVRDGYTCRIRDHFYTCYLNGARVDISKDGAHIFLKYPYKKSTFLKLIASDVASPEELIVSLLKKQGSAFTLERRD
ncbi:hypothetical protein [Actibacterium mucosum]|uniref:hypothetical protein n=1 Tax=Actibacterium mucosum TaxID=1087332 RepID=UPI0012688102|nr:hypothetical protein [Actibacterium mucosum]